MLIYIANCIYWEGRLHTHDLLGVVFHQTNDDLLDNVVYFPTVSNKKAHMSRSFIWFEQHTTHSTQHTTRAHYILVKKRPQVVTMSHRCVTTCSR